MNSAIKLIDELRGSTWKSERDIEDRLVRPLLTSLGWQLSRDNVQVWIPLTADKAGLWSYSSGRMCRDYILGQGIDAIHIEAKHRWSGWRAIDFSEFLDRINSDDWIGTGHDGPLKDLALLLWGAAAGSAGRAAVIDDERVLVFRRSPTWQVWVQARTFEDSPNVVAEALKALAP